LKRSAQRSRKHAAYEKVPNRIGWLMNNMQTMAFGWNLDASQSPTSAVSALHAKASPEQQRNPEKLSVWVVEDNLADVVLIQEALRENSVDVDLVVIQDGEAAYKRIEDLEATIKRCPSLVVLDLNLPRKSGHEILKLMRDGDRCASIPVIIFSSSDAASDKALVARHLGAQYIRKPSNLEDFMKIGSVVRGLLFGPPV
jgi:CheY-like chemotaxis protein